MKRSVTIKKTTRVKKNNNKRSVFRKYKSLKKNIGIGKYTRKNKKIGGAIFNDTEVSPGHKNREFTTIVERYGENYKINYIVPQTLLYKNVESFLAPEFFVKIKGEEKNCNIKIGDRYINYLAHIESEKTF